jgi:hypothetical protein
MHLLPSRKSLGLAVWLTAKCQLCRYAQETSHLCDVQTGCKLLQSAAYVDQTSVVVGPGNGNHIPKIWIEFQERVSATDDRLETTRSHSMCW